MSNPIELARLVVNKTIIPERKGRHVGKLGWGCASPRTREVAASATQSSDLTPTQGKAQGLLVLIRRASEEGNNRLFGVDRDARDRAASAGQNKPELLRKIRVYRY